jgi:hypothetical protein
MVAKLRLNGEEKYWVFTLTMSDCPKAIIEK